ncbi:MAG: DUF362 domain-containing protein [Planctomycetes bacterium]|nr:DUF362 domain-containing protein [Planctomycetota bacterium]
MDQATGSFGTPRATRRGFLRAVAGGGLGACLSTLRPTSVRASEPDNAASHSGSAAGRATSLDDEPLVVRAGALRSRVVQVDSSYVLTGSSVHKTRLREMLDACLIALTEAPTAGDAWHAILRDDDVIGIKFNRSGQDVLGTTRTTGAVLISSLVGAGWSPQRMVCIEGPDLLASTTGTAAPQPGYDRDPVDFGSGSDNLASVLGQVTALINVPYLKTHNIAGMTAAMKNLSHGLVRHPARYHRNGCSPYIADIVALPNIREKLRLNLVDALRIVYDGGPEASADNVADRGLLLASLDPVAIDAVGVQVLQEVRRETRGMAAASGPSPPRYLSAAHRRGLGMAVEDGIELRSIRM